MTKFLPTLAEPRRNIEQQSAWERAHDFGYSIGLSSAVGFAAVCGLAINSPAWRMTQLRPNPLPVLWAKVAPSDVAISCNFNFYAALRRYRRVAAGHLGQI